MSIDGTVALSFVANDRRTVGLNSSANLPVNFVPSVVFTNGSGANQVNQLFQAQLTLASGSNNVDLNGSLSDSYGTSVVLVRVKAIAIQNNSASNSMVFGNGTNPFNTLLSGTGTITLQPGAWFAAATPDATAWTVTASTADILKVTGTGTDPFTIVVLGSTT
jgi:hypothetical protein